MIDLCSDDEKPAKAPRLAKAPSAADQSQAGVRERPVNVLGDIQVVPQQAPAFARAPGDSDAHEEGFEVAVAAHVQNSRRTLPHSRQECGVHPFSDTGSPGNAAYCANCYCVVCDKPAQECAEWGNGSYNHHHCNYTKAQVAQNAPGAAGAAAPAAAAGPAAGMLGHMYPDEEEEEGYGGYDSDSMDYDGGCGNPYCAGCGLDGRRRRYGGFPYDDDSEDGLGDFGYGGYPYVGGVAPNINPWTTNNEDAPNYALTTKAGAASNYYNAGPEDKMKPLTHTAIVVPDATKQEQLTCIANLDFPLKLHGISVAHLRNSIAKAPWGYNSDGANLAQLRDWRSWKAVFNEKWSLPSIVLQQRFPKELPFSLKQAFEKRLAKDVEAPALPKRSVELQPLLPSPSDPKPPPVIYTIRTVLFVDCMGDAPLRVYGIPVKEKSTMVPFKKAVRKAALGVEVDSEGASWTPLHEDTTFELTSRSHTCGVFERSDDSIQYGHYLKQAPLVCWRVAAVDKTLSNVVKEAGNVHYVCVTMALATEAASQYGEPVKIAGVLPVPVLIPVQQQGQRHPICNKFNEKQAKLIVESVIKVVAKWSKKTAAELSQYQHLPDNLFAPLRSADYYGPFPENCFVGGHSSPGGLQLINLGRNRFKTLDGPVHMYNIPRVRALEPATSYDPSREGRPGLINLHLVLDKLPGLGAAAAGIEGVGELAQIVEPGAAVEHCGEAMFDLAALMRPEADASASERRLSKNQSYLEARKTYADFERQRKSMPLHLLETLCQLTRAPRSAPSALASTMSFPRTDAYTKCSITEVEGQPCLHVDVFVPNSNSLHNHGGIISKFDAIEGGMASKSRYAHVALPTNPAAPLIEHMLRGNAQLEETQKHFARGWTISLGNVLAKAEAPKDLPEHPQPPGLTAGITLHDYQRQSLKWMLDAERSTLRSKLWIPLPGRPAGDELWYCPLLGKLSANVPPGPRGGFLCEEMGLGKTVEVLALALANPAPAAVEAGAKVTTKDKVELTQCRGTLVVCKVSLVGQWVTEAKSKLADRTLRIMEYHGGARCRDVQRLAEHDVIVTTYETLVSDMQGRSKALKKGHANPLAQIKWWRIVFDESHAVKGTPINTNVSDLTGQLAALHMAPLSSKNFQTAHLKHGLTATQSSVMFLLKTLMIRHSKAAVEASGAMRLPPKSEETIEVALTKQEWLDYVESYNSVRAEYDRFAREGPSYCLTHTLSIMALLMPLKRLCSGGCFPRTMLQANSTRTRRHQQVVANRDAAAAAAPAPGAAPPPPDSNEPFFPTGDDLECSICMEDFEMPVATPCGHWFCAECINQVLGQRHTCPLCRTAVNKAHLRAAVYPPEPAPEEQLADAVKDEHGGDCDDDAMDLDDEAGPSTRRGGEVVMDSKLKVLVKELKAMHAKDASNKALIFTQYNDSLKFIGAALRGSGFAYRTISGSMPQKQRAAAIEAFQRDPPTTVFIISVRSGAVGINLTSANYVFMMEPLVNTALDDQAVGRAWRMGQKRRVTVKRLFVKGTFEESVLKIAEDHRKSGSAAQATNNKNKLGANQAGALRADKANLKFDEMNVLFSAPTPPPAMRAGLQIGGGAAQAAPVADDA